MTHLFIVFWMALLMIWADHLKAQDVFAAARGGDVKRLEELYQIRADTINARNTSGFSPLTIASYRKQLSAVEFLLNHGADVNADSPEGPAILSACYAGDLEITKLLIKHKADVNAVNENGTSALMFAVLSNKIEVVKLLLDNGAKKEEVEKSGKTAGDYAKIGASAEILQLVAD